METVQKKCCFKCKIEKPITDFGKVKKNKDGLNGKCKVCHNLASVLWSKNNPESRKKSREKWVENNPTYTTDYYEKNKEPILKRVSKYREENHETIKEKDRIRGQKKENKEKRNTRMRKRYNEDPDFKFSVKVMSYIRGIENRMEFIKEWGDVEDVYVMYGIEYHIDHLIPKTWFKSSTPINIVNDIRNLQVIDAVYNNTKLNRWADPVCPDYLEVAIPHIKKKFISKIENPQVV